MGLLILGAAVDPAADGRLRAGRLAGRPLRLDRREVLVVDRLRWRPASGYYRDELLDNLMLYWLPGTGASSARLYWESLRQVNEWISGSAGAPVIVPTGCSVFPKGLQRPSRRWAERRFPNIRYWNEPGKGGHFAAFEQPALFVDEVRSFFRLVR